MFSDGLRVFRRIARLPFSRQADAQGTARGGHIGTAHGVEVIAVGQVAAGEFRAEMLVEFVTHIGINHGNGLPVGVAVVAAEGRAVCAVALQVVVAPAGGGLLFVFDAAVEGQARTDLEFFI